MQRWHRDNLLWLIFAFDGEVADLPPRPEDARSIQQQTLYGRKTVSRDTYHLNPAGQIIFVQNSIGQKAADRLCITWDWAEEEGCIRRTVTDRAGPLVQLFTLWYDSKGQLSGAAMTTLEDGSEGDEQVFSVRQTRHQVWCDYGGEHQYTFSAAGYLTRWENKLRSLTFRYGNNPGELTRVVGVDAIHRPPEERTVSEYRFERGLLTEVTSRNADWGEFTEHYTYQFDQLGEPRSCTLDDALNTRKKWSFGD